MLSPLMEVSRDIRTLRRGVKLTQKQLALAVDCSQPYLSQVERGRRPVSRKIALRLEVVLEAPGLFTRAPFLRGRPSRTPRSRLVLRELRAAAREVKLAPELGYTPKCPQAHQKWGVEDRVSGLGHILGLTAGELTEALERLWHKDERFWRNFNSLRFDSWSERFFLVILALLGGQLTGVRLSTLGCRLAAVNGKTGKDYQGTHRTFLFEYQGTSIAWIPQLPVRTRSQYRCPDNVLVVTRHGRSVTALVEVEGKSFHTFDESLRRADELGVSVLHLDSACVGHPGTIQEILDWAVSLVA